MVKKQTPEILHTQRKKVQASKEMRRFERAVPFMLMALPALIYLLVNNYIPMAGLTVAFKNVNYVDGIWKSPWCGLRNFDFLLKNPNLKQMVVNTLGYNAIFLTTGTILSVLVAVFLNELCDKFLPKFYQTAFIMPYLLSWTVVSYMLYAFLNPSYGLLNKLLENVLHVDGISWYTQPKYWRIILPILNIWKTDSYTSVIYLASIVGIDESYYEAAALDGASRWQRIWYVTLPSILPTIVTMFILSIGKICYADFGLFYQTTMGSGMLTEATNVIDVFVYKALLESGDVGNAAAAGFLQSVFGCILVVGSNLVVRKIDKEQALF